VIPETIASIEEARAILAAETHLTPQDIRDILDCSPSELALLLKVYREDGRAPDATPWDTFLKVMSICLPLIGMVAPMATAVSTVYGLIKGTSK